MIRPGAALLIGCSLLSLLATPAQTHTRSRSHSVWQITGQGADVRLHVSDLDLSRLPATAFEGLGAAPVAQYLIEHLVLESGHRPCRLASLPVLRPGREGFRVLSWSVRCPSATSLVVESSLFQEVAPSHIHFARLVQDGETIREALLAGEQRRFDLAGDGDAAASSATTLPGYLALGFEHILSGWDHLVFILALLLLARRFVELATLITAFTVAHSITLAVAALGWVQPRPAAVEAWIGFSIALVAAENVWLLSGRRPGIPVASVGAPLALAALAGVGVGAVAAPGWLGLALFTACHFALLARRADPGSLRAAVAFGFGCIHGFGFSGVLAELELPRERLLPALFGFNVGVEIGQLAVVALCWPLLLGLARFRRGSVLRGVNELASAGIAGLGVFWLVSRVFH